MRSEISKIWNLSVPPRCKIFAWLLLHGRILTAENLHKRGFNLPSICYMCRANGETMEHLFTECTTSASVHQGVRQKMLGYMRGLPRRVDKCIMTDNSICKEGRELVLISNFVIWRERCNRLFKEKLKPIDELVQEVLAQWRIRQHKVN